MNFSRNFFSKISKTWFSSNLLSIERDSSFLGSSCELLGSTSVRLISFLSCSQISKAKWKISSLLIKFFRLFSSILYKISFAYLFQSSPIKKKMNKEWRIGLYYLNIHWDFFWKSHIWWNKSWMSLRKYRISKNNMWGFPD